MLASAGLSQSAKSRGLFILLASTFLMWAGFFMVIPLLSVYYVDKLGWAAASIGLALALRQLFQQGLGPVSGVLADRLGPKWLICAGLLVRTVGFGLMAWAHTFPLLLLSVALAGLGGSLFDSPRSAAIAALTDESSRSRYYAISGVVSGLGLTLGTQLGVLLLGLDFDTVAIASAIFYIVTFILNVALLPSVSVASEDIKKSGMTSGLKLALHDRPFIVFSLLLMGYWFMWVQITISFPLAAKDIGGTADTVSWMYTLNSAISILFQYPVIRLASRWWKPLPILVMGTTLMGLGMGGIAMANSVLVLMLCVVLFAAGTLLANPSQQTVAANLANPAAYGSYMGINSLALAIGGSMGNLSGGLLYDAGRQMAFPPLPWLVFGAVGLLTAAGLWLLALSHRRARLQQPVEMPAVVAEEPAQGSPVAAD